LVLGATGIVGQDVLSTEENAYNTAYNIILSSQNNIDTVINNRSLGNSFSILNSGSNNDRKGCHYDTVNKTLIVNHRINTFRSDMAINQSSDVNLWVDGKAWLKDLRIGDADSTTPGYYLKAIDSSGNTEFAPLAIDASFSGFTNNPVTSDTVLKRYPMNISSNNSITTIGFTSVKSTGSDLDHGQMLVWNGSRWKDTSFIKAYETDDGSVCRGIEFGANAKIKNTGSIHNHIFAGGTFNKNAQSYDGSSQYSMRYLRGRTTTGGTRVELTSDFDKTGNNPSPSQYNTIDLSYIDGGPVSYYRVWSFNIEVSLLYESNAGGAPPPTGAVFFIQGGVATTGGSATPILLGTNISTSRGTVPNGVGIEVFPTGGPNRLAVCVTGINNISCLWSLTARLNELTVPSNRKLDDND
jgi:hypothetical protein